MKQEFERLLVAVAIEPVEWAVEELVEELAENLVAPPAGVPEKPGAGKLAELLAVASAA